MMRLVARVVRAVVCASILAAAQAPDPAVAAIIGVSGWGNVLVPNATPNTGATADFFNDNTRRSILIHGWDEQQDVLLGSAITVDIIDPGTYQRRFTSAGAIIDAGTLVSSHLLVFDPLLGRTRTATFVFDEDILGVIVQSNTRRVVADRFLATDFLGNSFTVYPGAHVRNRGIEFGREQVILGADRRTLTVTLRASSPGDQVRVITASYVGGGSIDPGPSENPAAEEDPGGSIGGDGGPNGDPYVGPSSAVPGPTPFLLLVSGLVALGGISWYRERRIGARPKPPAA